MKALEVERAAILLHRLEALKDWVATVDKSHDQYWRFVEFESAATPIFSSSTGYGEHDTDGALVFSRLEMMGLFKIIADNTRQQLAALGVEVE